MSWTATAHPLKPKSALFDYISATRDYAYQYKNSSIPTGYEYYSSSTYFAASGVKRYAPLQVYSGGNVGFNYLITDSGIIAEAPNSAVLYAELLPLTDLVGANVIKEIRFNGETVTTELHDVDEETIDTWFYINSFAWYNNDNNGNYDLFNPRTVMANSIYYDVFLPYELKTFRYWSNGREFNATANSSGAIGFLGNMHHTPIYYANGAIQFKPYTQRVAGLELTVFGRTFSVMASETATVGTRVTAFPSKEKFTEYCKLWGISVFYDLDSVQYDNAPVDGQPDNPDPEDTPEGTGDNTSDSVHIPDVKNLPRGFYNQLWVDNSNLVALKSYLFGDTFLNDIRLLWNDPLEALVSVVFYPFAPEIVHNMPFTPTVPLGSDMLSIGNIVNVESVTGRAMSTVLNYGTMYIDMGEYTIEPYFGRYLDYNGYTNVSVYLPYIGERNLDTAEVMGKTLHLIYYPDFVTNTFLGVLYADGQPIAEYTSSFGINVPLSGTAHNEYAKNILSGVFNTVVSIGASNNATSGAAAFAKGAFDVLMTEQHVKQVGNISPSSGLYAPQHPYLIISRPYMSRPSAWDTLRGTAAGFSTIVGDCTGYLEVEEIRLVSNDIMTDTEQSEIESMLKGGVYI